MNHDLNKLLFVADLSPIVDILKLADFQSSSQKIKQIDGPCKNVSDNIPSQR